MNENLPASQSRETNADSGNREEQALYTVRHNKQERKLTMDELVKAAEKGLDYDRIRPSHEFVKKLAAQSGQSDVGRYIASYNGDGEPVKPEAPAADSLFGGLGRLMEECPEVMQDGKLTIPPEMGELMAGGMDAPAAYRACELKSAREECARLRGQLEAERANFDHRMASTGSLSGGDVPSKDYYTSEEWDRLLAEAKQKLIANGKIYEFMKKWSGNG